MTLLSVACAACDFVPRAKRQWICVRKSDKSVERSFCL